MSWNAELCFKHHFHYHQKQPPSASSSSFRKHHKHRQLGANWLQIRDLTSLSPSPCLLRKWSKEAGKRERQHRENSEGRRIGSSHTITDFSDFKRYVTMMSVRQAENNRSGSKRPAAQVRGLWEQESGNRRKRSGRHFSYWSFLTTAFSLRE